MQVFKIKVFLRRKLLKALHFISLLIVKIFFLVLSTIFSKKAFQVAFKQALLRLIWPTRPQVMTVLIIGIKARTAYTGTCYCRS